MAAKNYLLTSDSGEILGIYTTGGPGPAGSVEVGKDIILTDIELSEVEMNKKWNNSTRALEELSQAEKNQKSGREFPTLPQLRRS